MPTPNKKSGTSNDKERKKQVRTVKKAYRTYKKMKKWPTAILLLIVLAVIAYVVVQNYDAILKAFGLGPETPPKTPVSGVVAVHIIDVGQGDSILIETESGYMLIDAGTPECRKDLEKYLKDEGVSEIEYFVLTHAHDDHTGSAKMIFDEFTVKNVIYENYGYSATFTDMLESSGATLIDPSLRDTYDLGQTHFTVLSPDPIDYGTNKNDYSVVLKMEYGETSFVFTGDATKKVEKKILDAFSPQELDCDFLKSGHHGSKTSSSEAFITTLSPEIIAISCGLNNQYNLPSPEVLALYDEYKIPYYRTDQEGTLVFITDGTTITLEQNGA